MPEDYTYSLRGTILVVDDEESFRDIMTRVLRQFGHQVLQAEDGTRALKILADAPVDAVVTDLEMPGASGIEVLRAAAACQPPVPAVIVTAYGTAESAVQAMKLGAVDYVLKPLETEDLQTCLHQALERRLMLAGCLADNQENSGFGGLLGTSPAMQDMLDQIRRAAPFKSTVLITGESGTGKELVARAIHALSPCKDGPFLAVNCSALPHELVESQLFGHEKGAFTGAASMHRGFFEAADGGTLFLDEVGDLPLEAQAKLLRVLEERQVTRLGSTRSLPVDVRLLAATNTHLQEGMRQGRFRQDLYYRLDVLAISLPPLRQRRADIPLLIRIFLDSFGRDNSLPPREIAADAVDCLAAYAWPGNVRELKNICERLAIMTRNQTIQVSDLPASIRQQDEAAPSFFSEAPAISPLNIEEIERATIHRAMAQTRGNRTQAAELLGISLRTLQRKLKEYGDEFADA